ncbi:MAG: bifunctional diguanylate cyclase/phosphodiesterase [Gammaproteobacteria bacterium]|nr:bifunctional diguanylate cyclase/phosphodiesterase [Gammaproteobacteria bacterium]
MKTANPSFAGPSPLPPDPLTGLQTRAAFRELVEAHVSLGRQGHRPFGLIMLDLDRFKVINYGYSERCGNLLIQQVGQLARQMLGERGQVGRWGGQEFLCLLRDADRDTTDSTAERLRQAIESMTLKADGYEIHASASFGTACFPEDATTAEQLIAACGAAMYQAKNSGRNRVIHADALHGQVFGLGKLLDAALREHRVVPAYQPIVDLRGGAVVAEEALARVIGVNSEPLAADQFIEAARQLQITHQIDRAIILTVIEHCMRQQRITPNMAHFVNISGNLLRHPKVVAELLESARRACASCGDLVGFTKPLVIEVTERELLHDLDATRNMLRPFLDFGLRLALDDFGSGYSSFKYLADLPFAFVKIEGTLIQRIRETRVRTIVQGIQKAAADLGLITVAEFVESEEVAEIVSAIGVDWAQGYYFGRPELPASS